MLVQVQSSKRLVLEAGTEGFASPSSSAVCPKFSIVHRCETGTWDASAVLLIQVRLAKHPSRRAALVFRVSARILGFPITTLTFPSSPSEN
eukprot:280056-Pyramimonas_sp.AAC.2